MDKEELEVRVGIQLKTYLKMQQYCVFQERSHQEVRNKLYLSGMYEEEVESIISKLIDEDFLNEERFAKAFAGGKFRIKKWGRVKIKAELKAHRVSDYCIKIALKEIDTEEYIKTLKEVLQKKGKEIKEKNVRLKQMKIVRFAMSRGFESDLIREFIGS